MIEEREIPLPGEAVDESVLVEREAAPAAAVDVRDPMTIEAIERDPMNAVTLDLPPDAGEELLAAVVHAARDVKREAHLHLTEGHDDAGRLSELADMRVDEADHKLGTILEK